MEDDTFVAELAADMLGELGFETTVTHSAKEALERLAGGEKPKLVFTDVVMPGGITGIELAHKLRERFPGAADPADDRVQRAGRTPRRASRCCRSRTSSTRWQRRSATC